jgi:hypothetical protein
MKNESDLIKPNLQYRPYTTNEVCRIINPKQRDLYIKHRVFPIDIYPSIDDNGNDINVYIFLREETKELYQDWLNRELK